MSAPIGLKLTHAIVGCSDMAITAKFLEGLGFSETRSDRIPADLASSLYGVAGPVETLSVSMPGTAVGWIRLVEAAGEPLGWQPYHAGPVILEIFTLSLDDAVSRARDAGASVAATVDFSRGDKRNKEARLVGPDQLQIGFTESTGSRQALLDSGRSQSEVVSMLWVVESIAAALLDYPELEVQSDFSATEWAPAHVFLGVPDSAPAIRTVMLGEPGTPPGRLQLLEFSRHPPGPALVRWPIRPGIFATGCTSPIETPTTSERTGGVRLEIWPAQ